MQEKESGMQEKESTMVVWRKQGLCGWELILYQLTPGGVECPHESRFGEIF